MSVSCSNPQNGGDIQAYTDGTSSCESTIYTYYGGGSSRPRTTQAARMVDYVWGASSLWDTPAMPGLGIPIQEGGGSGNNWMQVLSGASKFESFMSTYNVTGVTFDDSTIDSCDAVNAMAALYYLHYLFDNDPYSGNEGLRWALNAYEAGSGQTPVELLTQGGYGYSVLFKAFGNTYSSADGLSYIGAYMATDPSGDQYETGWGTTSTSQLPTPGFPVPSAQYHVPWGSDSSTEERRILLFVANDTATASAAIICQNFNQASYPVFPVVLSDVAFAANSASKGLTYCVIAVGTAAVTALSQQDSSLHQYTDFSNWEGQASGAGFIACDSTDGATNYSNANTYALNAYAHGW